MEQNMVKDSATKFRELYESELNTKRYRIDRALKGDKGITRGEQINIARWLYESRWDGHSYEDEVTKEEILDNFCGNVFGCNLEEMLQAYDNFLEKENK